MKSITRLTKFFQTRKSLFMILVVVLNQIVFAQDDGYWDNRLRLQNYSDAISAIAVKDSYIFIDGGNAALIWNGKHWEERLAIVNRSVIALAIIGNDLYVGGKFTTVGSTYPLGPDTISVNNIAKWNFVTKSWSALEKNGNNGVNGTVWALAVRGNKLYVGGEFTMAGGVPSNGIAVWKDSSKTWMPLGQGVNGTVRAIVAIGKNLYVGGTFTSAGGKPANNIAKWDGREWYALGGGADLEGKPFRGIPHVNAIAIFGQDVYVGGYFTMAGDVNVNHIAKWNTRDKSWSALSSGTKNGVYNSGIANVYAIAANDRALYVGGTFNMAGDQNANNIAKWDPVNNTWSPLGSGVGGQVFAITTHNKDAYVGGGFSYAGGMRSDRFAIWHEPNDPPVLAAVPELRFDEDKSLLYPIRNWYPFVTDQDHADSTLAFSIVSGKNVKAIRQTSNLRFSAPPNWFGKDTLQLIVKDPGQLADTTALPVTVNPINDAPKISGLPDSLSFNKGAAAQLKIWDFVEDVETPDSLLNYGFSANNPSLRLNFNRQSGLLTLTAPQFHGRAKLFVNINDGKASARDTINVNVIYVNDPPVISALPMLSFDEDKSLLYPIRNWYALVADKDHADSTLAFVVVSGKKVSAAMQDNNFIFSAPANWFGKDTLQLIVTDPEKLADTTALMVTVNPVNDAPAITGLPDPLVFPKGGSAQLKLWDYVEDVETPDRQLAYTFSTSNSSLLRKFDYTTGTLVLTAPQFHGRAQLFINVSDTKATAHDTVAVRVELPTSVASSGHAGLPTAFQLWPNSPNPFNPGTTIRFDTPYAGRVKLAVYTLRGELVQTLVDGEMAGGAHAVRFDGRNLASGVYFYRMETDTYVMTRKMLLQK
jgi:hypothetical protein